MCHGLLGGLKEVTQRATRGRPRHDAPDPTTTTVYRVRPTIGAVDAQRVQAAQDRAATFVLITNLPSTPFDARRLLEEYKGQIVIEQRFRFLKDPTFVDVLYVQKPERVEALGYVLLLAALVLSLIERRARQAPPLPTPTRGLLARPTGQEVLHHLRGLIVMPLDAQTRQLFVPAVHTQPVAAIFGHFGRIGFHRHDLHAGAIETLGINSSAFTHHVRKRSFMMGP